MKKQVIRIFSILFCISMLFSTFSLQTVKAQNNSSLIHTQQSIFTLSTPAQGSLTNAGATVSFTLTITNISNSTDTFDLKPTTTWTASYFKADGTTLLTDTNSNGFYDTGSLAKSQNTTIVIKVQTPANAVAGDSNLLSLSIVSSNDPGSSQILTFQTAVPFPFAQAYYDNSKGTMNLLLAQSTSHGEKRITGSNNDEDANSENPTILQTPNGNLAYLWNKYTESGPSNDYGEEIYFSLLTSYGDIVVPTTYLIRNEDAYPGENDYSPSTAVTPDGHIAILWTREIRELINSQWESNFNLYLAIMDENGHWILNPTNITNSNLWGDADTKPTGLLVYSSPKITATSDNRFVYSTNERSFPSQCSGKSNCYLYDIYYGVLSENGTSIKTLTRLTSDTTGNSEKYGLASLATVNGNQAFLSMIRGSQDNLYYAAITSDGTISKNITQISTNGTENRNPLAAQFSDGKIILTWQTIDTGELYYQILTSGFASSKSPTVITNPFDLTNCGNASVSTDSSAHAIVTWQCDSQSIFYTLMQSSGTLLTSPMPLIGSITEDNDNVSISNYGHGNTFSKAFTASTGVDTVISLLKPNTLGFAGQMVIIKGVQYANHGQTTATHVVLTATLSGGLTYTDDSSGITPSVNGDTVTWDLPDLAFLQSGLFNLFVTLPAGALPGTHDTVTFNLSALNESNSSDNTVQADVEVAYQIFIPLLQH